MRWWLVYAAGALAVVAATAWISAHTLAAERAAATARAETTHGERVRLALWRLEARLAPLVAREAAWPPAAFSPFIADAGGMVPAAGGFCSTGALLPSPLLGGPGEGVRLHIHWPAAGAPRSPEAPPPPWRDLALRQGVEAADIAIAEAHLADFAARCAHGDLLAALPAATTPRALPARMVPTATALLQTPVQAVQELGGQTLVANNDFDQRALYNTSQQVEVVANAAPVPLNKGKNFQQNRNRQLQMPARLEHPDGTERQRYDDRARTDAPYRLGMLPLPSAPASWAVENPNGNVLAITDNNWTTARVEVRDSLGAPPLAPLWHRDELLLARRLADDAVQVVWLDWPALRTALPRELADLLPQARLLPDTAMAPERLAALPLRLDPGPPPASPVPAVPAALWWTWALVGLVLAGGAALLAAALRLGARRAAFVSAVTHELRTPLTGMRLHTELLADGLIADADERATSLGLVRRETARLGQLVENVLAFARVERGRGLAVRSVPVAALLDAARERLTARLPGLVETHAPAALAAVVRAEPQAVERVLFNLIDNAAKYAPGSLVELAASRRGQRVLISVRDHGPGLGTGARTLFRPFARSAADAAGGAPGVGLGLALCRRVARQLGGDLWHEAPAGGGARFVLMLRCV
jgi:signal transduction histidine kinase